MLSKMLVLSCTRCIGCGLLWAEPCIVRLSWLIGGEDLIEAASAALGLFLLERIVVRFEGSARCYPTGEVTDGSFIAARPPSGYVWL